MESRMIQFAKHTVFYRCGNKNRDATTSDLTNNGDWPIDTWLVLDISFHFSLPVWDTQSTWWWFLSIILTGLFYFSWHFNCCHVYIYIYYIYIYIYILYIYIYYIIYIYTVYNHAYGPRPAASPWYPPIPFPAQQRQQWGKLDPSLSLHTTCHIHRYWWYMINATNEILE